MHESIVERLAAEAIHRGADLLDVEYKNDCEDVVAAKGGLGHGIARFRRSSPEAVTNRTGTVFGPADCRRSRLQRWIRRVNDSARTRQKNAVYSRR
jgi:hypothetical protein